MRLVHGARVFDADKQFLRPLRNALFDKTPVMTGFNGINISKTNVVSSAENDLECMFYIIISKSSPLNFIKELNRSTVEEFCQLENTFGL